MGRLWDLVESYVDSRRPFEISERKLASQLGYKSSSTFDGWKNPKSLPGAYHLALFAHLAHIPYQRVLDAALEDVGYLPEPSVQAAQFGTGRRRLSMQRLVDQAALEDD